jgi:flagellar basal-body rod modification protein FlgD
LPELEGDIMVDTSSIQASSQTSSNQSTAPAGPNQTLGQDQFMKLLIAQLQNQDPTNPVDNSQMIAQLAQFSQLQETQQMTKSLNQFIAQQNTANATNLVTLLGKHVTASGSTFSLTSGTQVPLSYTLGGRAATATVQILNSSGVPVATWTGKNQAAGAQTLTWNGTDSSGNTLPSGTYSFTVSATGANGAAVSATTQMTGVVTSIKYDGNGPVLVFDSGQTVLPSTIVNVTN